MDEEQKRLAEELLFSEKKNPSFAKLLYFGTFDSAKVFPYPSTLKNAKSSLEPFFEKLKAFTSEKIDPVAIDRNAQIPDEVLKGLGELGVLGMTIPQEYGGLGESQAAYCKATEILAYRCASTALFVNAHQSVGLKAILLFGTEQQKRLYLPQLAKGEAYAAFSLTEPNAGSDAAGIETRAEFDSVKKIYKIKGRKQWTTNGSIAKVLTVMAKTEVGGQEKITAFIVTPEMPGFKVTAKSLEKVGMRGTWTSNLEFDNIEVPLENILGNLGGGLKLCLTVLDYGRTTFGATCTGAAKFALEKAIYHAKTRYQFRRPLASFTLVKKKIAKLSALVYAMEATTYLTAGFVDQNREDFMLESAMLKVFASDSLWEIIYETMQIYGGRSFFTDQPFERMMRDARLNMIGEGSNEVMRAFIGVVGMRDVGMYFKELLESLRHPIRKRSFLSKAFKQFFKRLRIPKVEVQSSLIQKEARELGKAVRRFGFAVVKVLGRYREEIVEKQLILDRIATSAMSIYTITAVLGRLDADLTTAKNDTKSLQDDIKIAKLYCRFALKKLDNALNTLNEPDDALIEAVSDAQTGLKSQ